MLQVGVARLLDRVVVDVDDVVEHAHRGARWSSAAWRGRAHHAVGRRPCAASRLTEPRLQTAISVSLVLSVISVHRLEECTTPTCCCGERTLQASLNVIHGMAGLEQHREHACATARLAGMLLEQLDLAARRPCPRSARRPPRTSRPNRSCRSGHVGRREQRPVAAFHHALHEQVGNPVRRVHVVRAAAVVAGVLAQLEELLDVEVPRLEVRAHRALALAALVDGHGRVVDHLEEGHHALRLAVGALDVASPARARWSSRCPGRRRTWTAARFP